MGMSYPPNSDTTLSTFDVTSKLKNNHSVDYGRNISRTPSPTPEEYNLLHGIKPVRTTRQKITTYAIVAVLIGLGILLSVETKNIVHALKPATDWLHDHTFGPLIPIAIIIILSFPPLFGQELVATVVGVTWDLPKAFAIVAIGTVLGEVANFFTFKYACSARGAKLEVKNLDYGLLAYVVRNGSFWVILIIRYSAIPPHFATTVFSTVGISFWIFLAAAILSLPKQLVPVYIGYVMQPSVEDDGTSKIVENVVLVLGIVTTIAAYIWIQRKIKAATPAFVYGRRKARQDEGGAPSHYIDVSLPAEA
ncbi:hypothetical protein DFH08DRAFT_294126 [Mycena albidolilacea]|uniref:Golgi apparatus membrane protein TVP38 n=1 Tax=Mycena albidolilacea TaxID=1033008 RepID=A0AAD7EMF3_9AGAR|nr:hypothetical protein DFH08DRAFT_294126 [Mycena albidolilacea]